MKLCKIEMKYVKQNYSVEYLANNKGQFRVISFPQINDPKQLSLLYVDEDNNCKKDVYENEAADEVINKLANDEGIIAKGPEYIHPSVTYMDITENLLLGSEIITQEYLVEKNRGIWADYGTRKIKVQFSKEIESFNGLVSARINFYMVKGEEYKKQNFATDYFEIDRGKKEVVIDLDTDFMGEVFKSDYKNEYRLQFGGDIEIKCVTLDDRTVIHKYPIEITLTNTNPKKCDSELISRTPASVDFGTSSTCVAIENVGKIELLCLSPSDKQPDGTGSENNIFENPTNIMVYRWDNLFKEWNKLNTDMPLPRKGDKTAYLSERIDFDFGYSVKDILGEEDTSRKELNSIISLIKMIPYQIMQKREQLNFNPYDNSGSYVDIVCNPDKEDEKHFDPVAFYGYLIGRTVNDLSKRNKIYTKFYVTSPVMFNKDIKEAIRKSILYGIKKTVPKKMRDSVEVYMEYTEPVAYIGALCGQKYFKIPENEKRYFAVYDFGGGTLDFSFGVVENKDDDLTFNILKVGGRENFGGEILIERIAFDIYCDNEEEIKDKRIPMMLPFGADKPDSISEGYFKENAYAKANMNIICAKVARKIFEDEEVDTNIQVQLYDENGELTDCQLTVKEDDLNEDLESIILDTISSFKRELKQAFRDEDGFVEDDVCIFRAGNSSKSKHVEDGMKKIFPNNSNIQLVDQISDGTEENKRYALTPKTAVAFGQLRLNNFAVQGDFGFFKYYLGYFGGMGSFKICVDNSEKHGEWKKFKKINNNSIDVYYSTYIPEEKESARINRIPISVENHKDEMLWIRIKDDVTFEYCIGAYDSAEQIPDDVTVYSQKLM